MIMHCSESQMAGLAQEIALATVELSRHAHGNFVVQHLLEYGTEACRCEILRRLMPEMSLLAIDRTASHVVEKAIEFSEIQEQCLIAMALLQAPKPISIVDVACSRCGSSILAELAENDACATQLRLQLGMALPRLVQSKFGRRVLDRFELMPLVWAH